MQAENGETVPGAFTVRLLVTRPSGDVCGISDYVGMADGRCRLSVPIGANDDLGDWKVSFEGGFPRRTVERRLAVSTGRTAAVRLQVKPAPETV